MTARASVMSRTAMLDVAHHLQLSIDEIRTRLGGLKSTQASLSHSQVRELVQGLGIQYPQQVLSFQMLKGGVAKTTSAYFLGKRLAQFGAKVLFVDLDQQANLTYALGFEDESHPTWVDLIEGKTDLPSMLVTVDEGIDLIPSNLNNSVLDRVLMRTQRNWAMAVKGPLTKIRANYDFVMIDLAPALSVINTAATLASDLVILPVNPDKFSMVGLGKHLQELNITKDEFAADFATKILFTKFDVREKMSEFYLKSCLSQYEKLLFTTYIRSSVEIKNALELKKDIFSVKTGIRQDFDDLAVEVLKWDELKLSKVEYPPAAVADEAKEQLSFETADHGTTEEGEA